MTDTPKTKNAFIVSDFKDAGTETRFTAGRIVPIEEGAFANYEHAGLVREPTAEDRKDAGKPVSATPVAPPA